MKVISLRPRKHLLPPQAAEGKSNNIFKKNIASWKASIIACLFLLFTLTHQSFSQQWSFNENCQQAYDLVLNLQVEEALQRIPEPKTAQEHYIVSLAEALELMITEDGGKFSEYEDHFKTRVDQKIKSSIQDHQFLHAEMRLQWSFIYLKFGHEFDAALNFREAYHLATECKKRTPEYIAIKKTSGLLDVIIGSVPDKYNWVLGLLGMQGSIPAGLTDLQQFRKSNSPLAFEADLIYSLAQGYVFQKSDSALAELGKALTQKPNNRLALFVAASLAIKSSQSEDALNFLTTLSENPQGIPIHFAEYLKGEVYLHKADYLNAISSYRWFLNHYTGQNYSKDAHYKIAMCYWLNGNVNDAMILFKEAKTKGKEASEADKAAARSLSEKEFPHVKLSKVRYFTDGGYYNEAQQLVASLTDKDLSTKRSQTEYHYRKARLSHKTNQLEAAKVSYLQTIELAGEENWYFAPNACLQLGNIYLLEGNTTEARRYFEKALDYKSHEYKNSIDSKAQSAIRRLRQ